MLRALALSLTSAALAACSIAIGGRPETCGEYPAGGGPAVIVTQDQELCELTRLRVLRRLDGMKDLTQATIDRLLERTISWGNRAGVEDLLAAVRGDAGDEFADEMGRAVQSVLAQSTRTTRAECGPVERCLVQGAAKGARIALLFAVPSHVPATGAPDAPK